MSNLFKIFRFLTLETYIEFTVLSFSILIVFWSFLLAFVAQSDATFFAFYTFFGFDFTQNGLEIWFGLTLFVSWKNLMIKVQKSLVCYLTIFLRFYSNVGQTLKIIRRICVGQLHLRKPLKFIIWNSFRFIGNR